jgi:hypothetical protein
MTALLGFIRLPLRMQFSLASFLLLTTAAPIGLWIWYYRPFPVEQKVLSLEPICLSVSPQEQAAILARPRDFREVQYMRRVAGGTTIPHGPYRGYDAQGNLLRTGHYRNGVPHGTFEMFAPSGAKTSECTYSEGSLEGYYLQWNVAGALLQCDGYKHGKLHGLSRTWHRDGVLAREEFYQHGVRHGPFSNWDASGLRLARGAYHQGSPIGPWTWFLFRGDITEVNGQWRDGRAHGKWIWLASDKQQYLVAHFEDGHVLHLEPDFLSPRILEQVACEAAGTPESLAVHFAPLEPFHPQSTLVDLGLMVQRRFDDIRLDDSNWLGGLPGSLYVPDELSSDPLLIVLAKMLRNLGLGYDLRYGQIVLDSPESIARWQDPTGVLTLRPAMESKVAAALDAPTYLDVVELPLVDVLEYLSAFHGISIRAADPFLQDAHRTLPASEVLVTTTFRSISLRNSLGRLLSRLNYKVNLHDEVLTIEPQ